MIVYKAARRKGAVWKMGVMCIVILRDIQILKWKVHDD